MPNTVPADLDLATKRMKEVTKIMSRKKNLHVGSSLENFLENEGVFEELQTEAIKEVVAWQLGEAMKKRGFSKAGMAKLFYTNRTQVNRLLDPRGDITISSLGAPLHW